MLIFKSWKITKTQNENHPQFHFLWKEGKYRDKNIVNVLGIQLPYKIPTLLERMA